MEAGCSRFSGNREGRCYKVIGVSVKYENKAAVTWAKKWLSTQGLKSLIDRSKCQVKKLSQPIWILLRRRWKSHSRNGISLLPEHSKMRRQNCLALFSCDCDWPTLLFSHFLSSFWGKFWENCTPNFHFIWGPLLWRHRSFAAWNIPVKQLRVINWRAWFGTQAINLLVNTELPSSSHLFLLFRQCFCVWGRMKN